MLAHLSSELDDSYQHTPQVLESKPETIHAWPDKRNRAARDEENLEKSPSRREADGTHASMASSILSANHGLGRTNTAHSELRLIISAIHIDMEQDQHEFLRYQSRTLPEAILVKELDIGDVEDDCDENTGKNSGSGVGGNHHTTAQNAGPVDLDESFHEDHPVDGGFAVWQAFLVMLMIFSTWGANASFGVFLNYYISSDYFPGATQYEFALMGGVVVFLAQALGPAAVIGVRVFGARWVTIFGATLQFAAYILASFCTELWQIFMCQGVLVGLSFACIYIPGTLALPTWFKRRRALGMGIAVAGSGLGGLVFSLSVNALINKTGDQKWALRMVGIVNLVATAFSIVFFRVRNPKPVDIRKNLQWEELKKIFRVVFDLAAVKNLQIALVGVWFGLALMGYVIFVFSYAAYASSIGLSHSQGSSLIAIINAAQMVVRPSMGMLGDHFGRTNASILLSAYLAIFVWALWMNSTLYAELIVLAILAGGALGVGATMPQSLASDVYDKMGTPEKLPSGWAGLNIVAGCFCLPAEVIALKLRRNAGIKSYQHSQIFAGCLYFGGALVLLVNRSWLVQKTLEERREKVLEELHNFLLAEVEDEDDDSGEHVLGKEKLAVDSTREMLEKRVQWYDRLLETSVFYYFVRMFYPIRV